MKRITQRLIVIAGISGGLLAGIANAANALGNNHCEPVACDTRR